jgi:sigma-E factor negative regulatory protein RseB
VETIADTTVAGHSKVVATVWHRGGLTVTQVAGGKPEETYDGDGRAPDGVFGVTTTLVGLLEKHYVPVYMGTDSMVGRRALIIAVQRPDGTTAAEFWLDEQTLLPLRRDVYDTSAHLVSDDRFTQVRFGKTKMPQVTAGRGHAAWTVAPSPVQLLSRLNGEGSLLPRTLPGNLGLYAASVATTPVGQVADFGFSDGLSAVSLFVERGTLPAKMPGWQPERLSGHLVYVTQDEVAMSGRGFAAEDRGHGGGSAAAQRGTGNSGPPGTGPGPPGVRPGPLPLTPVEGRALTARRLTIPQLAPGSRTV